MKKIYLIAGMWAALFSAKAQQVATFEGFDLQPDSYYNGSDGAGGFQSSGIWFPNSYNAEINYWSGFSLSNMKDTIAAGYENQFSVITAGGADSSENFSVVYAPQELKLPFDDPVKVEGFYVTNSVYAYLSMREGDSYTKKFGGPDGTDPDYFLLRIAGIDAAGIPVDTVNFYLADFRSDNPDQDYIVNDWVWLDLSTLGVVKELSFQLESTDMSDWGINTPAYFCIDNFTIADLTSSSGKLQPYESRVRVFPNPVTDIFNVEVTSGSESITLFDSKGEILYHSLAISQNKMIIPALKNRPPGVYFLKVKTKSRTISEKIIKY